MSSTIDLYDVIVHETERDDPEPAFFYHSDHLVSAAYLTNDAGRVTQTLNHLPYGEDWVDIQNYAETRYPRLGIYRFNGKEKDYESGFHYYGARYYWSEVLTGWLGVDPMMDKYPNISPYNYCHWNPIVMVDPDGMDDWKLGENGELTWDKSTKGKNEDRIVAKNGQYVVVANGVLAKDDKNGGANYGPGASELTLNFHDNRENSEEVFEFLADHSNVEYTLLGSSSSMNEENASNFEIYGSFNPKGDSHGDDRANQLLAEGVLREHTHNHPSNDLAPSNPTNCKDGERNDFKSLRGTRAYEKKHDIKYPCTFKTYCNINRGTYRRYGGDISYSRINKKGKYKIQ